MKYAVQIGSCAMIYIPGFIKIGSVFRKLKRRGLTDVQTHRQHGDLINLLSLSRNMESRLKIFNNMTYGKMQNIGSVCKRMMFEFRDRPREWRRAISQS
jgi:hypothetical protein